MKTRLLFTFLCVVILSSCGPATPPPTEPVTKGQSIFASHHSLYSAIPPTLPEVAKAGGYPDQVTVGADMMGGSKAIQHWDIPAPTNQAKAALTGGKLDVL